MPSYFTTLGSPGRRFYGTLAKIEPTPTVTNNVVLYNALFDVPNPDRMLLPQMTAQVFFVAAEARNVLTVPVSALTMQRNATRRTAAAEPVDGEVVAKVSESPARGERAAGAPRRGNRTVAGNAQPLAATVKIASADGTLVEREVIVGVSNRVTAEIVAGLQEGERIVVGQRVPDAPRTAATKSATPFGAAGGIGGGPTGGGRR